MSEALLLGLALMLVFEGIMPFTSPTDGKPRCAGFPK